MSMESCGLVFYGFPIPQDWREESGVDDPEELLYTILKENGLRGVSIEWSGHIDGSQPEWVVISDTFRSGSEHWNYSGGSY